ncbi:YSC84-related protein [Desulfomicrobium sp. ZS1]|uniref:lipid-binding SYLF domain-containing protein n=1 Tax=Desulfomicrobium sp. ZS1 TaxID=2952228 RepID=UPI0020B204DB|nr:YSC84-related protein [Desulfomicrobium sp. ZS1]UTF50741.1 YSC84-related protein [Desulfomicrobium sp. ZS1]
MNEFIKKHMPDITHGVFLLVMLAMMCVFASAALARTAEEIDTHADMTLQRFYKEVNGGKEIAKEAKALLIMSDVTKAGFVLGGTYGQGALRVNGKTTGYYNLIAGSYGFTFGAEQMDIILAFMTQKALDDFIKIDGWEIGVTGNVAFIDVGGGKRVDTTSLKDPVVAFVFSPEGLMVDASLKGAKFTKLNK